MKLTPFAKAFIAVVILGVLGIATWHYEGDTIKRWAGGEKTAETGDSSGDFDKLKGGPDDPARGVGSTGVSSASVGTGRLNRPLVVGINTWAGHSPGIVFNNGMDPNAGSQYKKKYNMDVKFVLLEDPDLTSMLSSCCLKTRRPSSRRSAAVRSTLCGTQSTT